MRLICYLNEGLVQYESRFEFRQVVFRQVMFRQVVFRLNDLASR